MQKSHDDVRRITYRQIYVRRRTDSVGTIVLCVSAFLWRGSNEFQNTVHPVAGLTIYKSKSYKKQHSVR